MSPRSWRRWLLGAGALLLACLGAVACLRCQDASTVAPVSGPGPELPAQERPFPYAQAATMDSALDLLGINEAVSVPERFVNRGTLDREQILAHLEDDARQVAQLGARWVRVNSATYPFINWHTYKMRPAAQQRTDRYLALVQQAGLDVVLVVGPWPGNHTANYTERYVPDDMEGYQAWVQGLAERYDGDGVDDAPGLLRPVRYWEADNEPDLHNRILPRGAVRDFDPACFETPTEYAQVLAATAAAIRRAHPEAVVLNGGTFHTSKPWGQAYLQEVLNWEGQAVDVLSVHAYFEERTPDNFFAALDNAQALARGRPIFVTETGVPSQRRGSKWVDEQFQARMVALVVGEALARGVERVFWHTLCDPPALRKGAPNTGYSTHSLLRNLGEDASSGRQAKPSGQVFRRLAAILAEVELGEVRALAVEGGRAVELGPGLWLLYYGEEVSLPLASATVLDLLTEREAPMAGPVTAPALVWFEDQG